MRLESWPLALVALGLAARAAADVAPGEVVTAESRGKLRGLVPDEVYALAVDGFAELSMQIVETQDYPPHPKYVDPTIRSSV